VEAVAIISVVLTSLTAIAAIGANLWQQRQGFRHERGVVDRTAVRELLSRAAATLHQAEYAVDEAVAELVAYGASMFDDAHPERLAPYTKVEAVGVEFDKVLAEVRILLGPDHPATQSLEDADAAFLEAFRAMKMIRLEDPAIKGTYAEREVAAMVAIERDRARTGRENFKTAQEKFVRRAHAAAGAALPISEDQPDTE
jgi:hypothetical protein